MARAARHHAMIGLGGVSRKHRLINEKSPKDGLSPLLAAATNGHVEVVRCLIKNGAHINDTNPEGQTPLILAAKSDYLPLLRLLVHYGARLDLQDSSGRTALMHALAAGYLVLAKCLIDAGASQKPVDRDGKTALFVAAECGHVAIVEHLLGEPGADLTVRDKLGRTALMMLARTDRAQSVDKCIARDQLARLIEDRDSSGWTPLLHAAHAGSFSMARRLVEWGADPRVTTKDGRTAIMLACQRPQMNCSPDVDAGFCAANDAARDQKAFVSAMLGSGVALETVDKRGRTTLFYAVESAELEMVHHLLELGAGRLQVGARDDRGNTILHAAARMGREFIVRYLLDLPELSGAAEEANFDREVPLRLAIMSKCLSTVRVLIERGASLEMADRCREPPLLGLASESGAVEIADFLLKKGFHPDSADSEGVTPLMLAVRCDKISIAQRLLRASCNVNLSNSRGFTALALAVQTANTEMCKLLLKNKADPNLLPEGKIDSKTPISIAATLGKSTLVDLLLKKNANPVLKDLRGRNSLYFCVLMGKTSPLKLLIKGATPADLNEYFLHDGQQHTLMTLASEKGYLEVARLLLQSQASLETKTSLGESALHIACRRQNRSMVDLFLTCTTNFDCPRDGDHFTPLMIACQLGNREIVQELCRVGADMNVRTPDGYTALVLYLRESIVPASRVPILSLLLAFGAQFDSTTDMVLISQENRKLLNSLCKVGFASEDSQPPSQTAPPQQPQTQSTPQKRSPDAEKQAGDASVQKRLKDKPREKQLQPSPDSQSDPKAKRSLSTRAKQVPDEIREAAETTATGFRSMNGMVKHHIKNTLLAGDVSDDLAADSDSEIKRLYRASFALSQKQKDKSILVGEFSTRMSKLREETVHKFEAFLDGLSQLPPAIFATPQNGASPEDGLMAERAFEAPINQRRERREVQWRTLYQLKYDSKGAKKGSDKGLRSVLLKRLSVLKACPQDRLKTSRPFLKRRCQLPRFWEAARLRKFYKSQLAPWMRRIAQFGAATLEGVAEALGETAAWWEPMPELSVGPGSGLDDYELAKSWDLMLAPSWLRRWLEKSDNSSVLVRWAGRRCEQVKLSMTWKDRQRQIDLSWAIQPVAFHSTDRMLSRPGVAARLAVSTHHWLWNARELQALAEALDKSLPHDSATAGSRRLLLETLASHRRTYHLFSPAGSARPKQLQRVALHPLLSVKLLSLLLHSRLSQQLEPVYFIHGDDLVLQLQPGQQELGQLPDLLGPGRMQLIDTYRFN